MTLDRVEFFDNRATRTGGAIRSTGRSASLHIDDSFFHHNIATADVIYLAIT